MMTKKSKNPRIGWWRIMLWASAMAFAPNAHAQLVDSKEAPPPANAPSPEDMVKMSAEETNASASDARAELLEQQIAALQSQLDEIKKQLTKVTPSWKGAPLLADASTGWSFKPRGRLHYDVGFVGQPGAIENRNLGFATRIRRLRIGVEGTMPGRIGYKAEADFANSGVTFGDVWLTYANKNKTFGARLGNQESLNTLEQISSSNYVTFIERAQMNDAFINARRLGAVLGVYKGDDLRFEAGLFAAHAIDATLDNDGWIGSARFVAAPEVAGGRIHLGVNFQHREFSSNNGGTASTSIGAPSTNQLARYRARPFSQTTDVRFVDTGSFAAKGDTLVGLELAGVFKSFHFASEAQLAKVRAYNAGDIVSGLNSFSGGNSAVVPTGNPGFFSAYAELGYFLTGETRGYKEGLWGRTKVLNPVDKGGMGAFQLAARVDYLDLDSDKLKNGVTNNFTTGATTLAALNTRLGRGGKQTGYLLGLNWMPIDYVRIMMNYGHVQVQGGPLAAVAKPLSTAPIDQRKYSTDIFLMRAQLDF